MADTARTQAALLALFPDNTTRDISPQDLRDFVVSRLSSYAALKGTAVGAKALGGTPGTLLDTWYSNGVYGGDLTPDYTTGKITIGVTGTYLVLYGIQATRTSARTIVTAYVLKNGSTTVGGTTANYTDPSTFWSVDGDRPVSGMAIASFTAGDYIQVKAYRGASYTATAYPKYLVVVRLS